MKKLSTLPSVSDLLAEGYTEVKTSSGQSIYQKVDIKDKPSDSSGTGNAGTEGAGTEGGDPRYMELENLRYRYIAVMGLLGFSIATTIVGFFFPPVGIGFAALNCLAGLEMILLIQQLDCEYGNLMRNLDGGSLAYSISSSTQETGIIDPSGYIYEAVASNRVTDATVTLYEKVTSQDIYGEDVTTIQFWDAEPYKQNNPLQLDYMGQYMWDVPGGLWQVKCEKEGYEAAYSEWLEVSPLQFDVNLGLVSYEAPEISKIQAYSDYIDITFSKYVKPATVTGESLQVFMGDKALSGKIVYQNEEENPKNPEETFVSVVRFIPDEPLQIADSVSVKVSTDVVSYADVPVEKNISQEAKVEVRPKSITVTPEREVAAGETVEVQVSVEPADLVAGMKVSVKSTGIYSTLDKEELVLDDNGKAIVVITGNAPGTDYLTFTIADSQLQAQMSLNVIEDLTCKHEKAPIVEKEDPTCTTPGYLREKCPDCGELLNEETYAATGHKAVSDAAAPATCTETGKTAGTHCSVCGEVLTAQTIIAAKGHTWGEWNTVTAATALKTGTMSRKLPIPLQIKKWQ